MTDDDPFAGTRMTLGEHLDELRSRLFKGIAAVAIAFVVAWIFRDHVVEVATAPYHQAMGMLEEHHVAEAKELLAADPDRPRTDFFMTTEPDDERLRGFDERLKFIKPAEGFLFVLKVCFYAALVVGAPILLWQMWGFIAAGLYAREKFAVVRYFPWSVMFFVVGVLFGYLGVVPYGMYFLNKAIPLELALPQITVQYYLSFITTLCLAFGVVFQLPLVLTFLGATGMVDPASLSKYRGHFIVGAFVMAALLTPPDWVTQLMMAIPIVVLYEVGIVGARFAARRRARRLAAEAAPGGSDAGPAPTSET